MLEEEVGGGMGGRLQDLTVTIRVVTSRVKGRPP